MSGRNVMTVCMTQKHDHLDEFDMETVHEAQVKSDARTVGVTYCGLMFDLPEYILRNHGSMNREGATAQTLRLEGRLVTALEAGVPATCMLCVARVSL